MITVCRDKYSRLTAQRVRYGLPQGSVLSLLLVLLYISKSVYDLSQVFCFVVMIHSNCQFKQDIRPNSWWQKISNKWYWARTCEWNVFFRNNSKNRFSWKNHASYKKKKICKSFCSTVLSSRVFLNKKAMVILYCSLVASYFNDGSAVWGNTYPTNIICSSKITRENCE